MIQLTESACKNPLYLNNNLLTFHSDCEVFIRRPCGVIETSRSENPPIRIVAWSSDNKFALEYVQPDIGEIRLIQFDGHYYFRPKYKSAFMAERINSLEWAVSPNREAIVFCRNHRFILSYITNSKPIDSHFPDCTGNKFKMGKQSSIVVSETTRWFRSSIFEVYDFETERKTQWKANGSLVNLSNDLIITKHKNNFLIYDLEGELFMEFKIPIDKLSDMIVSPSGMVAFYDDSNLFVYHNKWDCFALEIGKITGVAIAPDELTLVVTGVNGACVIDI